MKKLLFSAVSLDVGGIETALVTLLNWLANQRENNEYKYDITLVLEKKEGVFLDQLDEKIEILEYIVSTNKIIPIRKAINLIKQLNFKSKYKNKFDFSCSYATYSKPASFVARAAAKECTLWVHGEYMAAFNNDIEEYIKFFDRIKTFKFKNVIFVSNNAKNIFVKTYQRWAQCKNINKKVIHNLINYNDMIEKSKEEIQDAKREEIFTFLNVGRHTEHDKKLTRMIEAAKKIKEDGLKFRILLIGDGRETTTYKEMVEKYNLQEEIIFLGRKRNPYPYFKIADSLLLTSQHEGFPVVYTEAMVLGLPIITTNVSDSKEVVDNKYGIVVEKNVNSIYNAMKQAIIEGINCNEKFNPEQYNKEIKEELQKLIG